MQAVKTKVILKALKDKKEKTSKATYSICFEKQVKDRLEEVSNELGLSMSYLVNELIKKDLM